MDERMERDVILLLADISGYTRFMLANRTAALHSQGIITELLEAVIAEVDLPLEVAKLEGDAVFIYAERREGRDWGSDCRRTGAGLARLVAAFDARLATLMGELSCPCEACQNLGRLRLKVVAHLGRAVRHRLGRFEELTGLDVILVHRLLKNQVAGDSYLLLTEPAFAALEPPEADAFEATRLEDADLGTLPLQVRLLAPPHPAPPPPAGLRNRIGMLVREIRWRWGAWRSPRA